MGHMLMAHLSLLPGGLTQSQSQNGHFNTKHIRKVLSQAAGGLAGRLCFRPPGAAHSCAKGKG